MARSKRVRIDGLEVSLNSYALTNMNLPVMDGNFNKNYSLLLERLYGRRF